jgi:hypothetical protein
MTMSDESNGHLLAMERVRDMFGDVVHDLAKGAIKFDRGLVQQVKDQLETIVEDYEKGMG